MLKFGGKSEVSSELGLQAVTLRSQVQRSRKKLFQLFNSCCEVERDSRGLVVDTICKHTKGSCNCNSN